MTDDIKKSDRGLHAATVAAGVAGALWRFAVESGADPCALETQSGIRPETLADPDARVPLASFVALMRSAKALTNNPAFALHYAAARDMREFSIVGLICYAAATMGEALAELSRFAQLAAEVDLAMGEPRFQIVPREDGLWLVDNRKNANAFPELTEAVWSRFVSETARHFPDAPFVLEVRVTHSDPGYAEEYARVLKAPVVFNSTMNALRIDPSWLSLPLHRPSEYTLALLTERASALMTDLDQSKTVRGQVEGVLLPILHKGEVEMARVAELLGTNAQALYRKLKAEGVLYEDVVDDLRHRMALYYLNAKGASVNETAYLVGFSDPSSFSRAFKRWTGRSPRGAKQTQVDEPQ